MSRVAIVTGGASGIGRSICDQLARQGARVVVVDVDGDAAAAAAADLVAQGAVALSTQVDVSDRTSVDAAVNMVRSELGPIRDQLKPKEHTLAVHLPAGVLRRHRRPRPGARHRRRHGRRRPYVG